MAANQARDLTEDKEIIVIPSKTVPQGITALVNFMPDLTSQENLENMTAEMERVKTAQITYAVRTTNIDGMDIEKGDIMAIGEGVRKVYEEVLVPAGMGDVAIYTELGRFMLAPYGCLVTRAIHEKHTHKEYIGVDACAVNLMRPAMYGAYHHITVAGKEDAPCDHKYDVTGSLCENNDKFAIDRMLPQIDMGDLLVIHDTGAHGFAMGYNYNGKLKSAELLLKEDGSVQMIRRAETPQDYFATLDVCPMMEKYLK